MREGLLEAGGGGGGAGRLGRPGPAPAAAREVPGGSGGTAALGTSAGCEGVLFALAAPLLAGAEGLGDAARPPECFPAGNQVSYVTHRDCALHSSDRTAIKASSSFSPPQWIPGGIKLIHPGCPRCNGA